MKKLLLSIPLFFMTASCTSISGESLSTTSGYRFSIGKGSPKARIFLVAGTEWFASHAKEIVAQRKLWLQNGYTEEQIACYYFPPMLGDKDVAKDFAPLFDDLRNCYLADPALLLIHIKEVASSNPESVYVYVSSTGRQPMVKTSYKYKTFEDKKKMESLFKLKNWSEPYFMEMVGYFNNNTDWSYSGVRKASIFAEQKPNEADKYLLTPRGLKAALATLPATTKKTVVLQGCYTGGFVLPAKKVGAENTLAGLSNITVVTSSEADTNNLDCLDGYPTENFGEAYGTALKKYSEELPKKKDAITSMDWKSIYKFSEQSAQEKGIFLNQKTLPFPQYYTN
jgi:hypothetical protein